MRWLGVVVGLAACGRLGYDATTDGAPGLDGGGGGLPDGGAPGVTLLSSSGDCPELAAGTSDIGVAWRDGADVMFARIDDSGAVLGGPLVAAAGLENLGCPTIAGVASGYLVAYSTGPLNRADIDAVSIAGDAPGAPFNLVFGSGDATSPRLRTRADVTALAWADQTGANNHTFALGISTGVGPPLQLSGDSSSNGRPRLAATDTGFVVTWNAGGALHLRELDAAGFPGGTEVTTEFAVAGEPAASAWTGSDLAVATATADDQMAVARLDLAGAVIRSNTFAAPRVREPSLVWTGAGMAVLWVDSFGRVEYNFALLDVDGGLLDQRAITEFGADTISRTSLVLTGRYLMALDTPSQQVLVKVIDR